MEEVEKALEEMRKAWADICDAFGVEPERKLQPEVLKNNIRATLMDLNTLENMEYVKNSGKTLESLQTGYLKCLIKTAYLPVEPKDGEVWREEVDRYVKEVIPQELASLYDLKVEDDGAYSLDMLLAEIQKVFSIANQLSIIQGMESGKVSPETFLSLVENFIYLNIGIVQTCNGNAVIMGEAVSFMKTIIKINDNIMKSISQMLSR